MTEEKKLSKNDKFCFDCHSKVSCFNECCSDVNIVLTPYDTIRLKKALGITSEEFLAKYAISPFTKDQKLPILFLKMGDNEKKQCQLVKEDGCSVYKDRPWACRMYPVGQAIPKGGGTYEDSEYYFLIKDGKCKGHEEKKERTIRNWMKGQGVLDYDYNGRSWMELTMHDFFVEGNELNPQQMDMYFTVCYNIDKFRRLVYSTDNFFELFEVEQNERDLMEYDDDVLLSFGIRWLRFSVFGEKVLQMTDKAKERVKEKAKKLAAQENKDKH